MFFYIQKHVTSIMVSNILGSYLSTNVNFYIQELAQVVGYDAQEGEISILSLPSDY